jgi:PAS domain S-box-containing protein
MTSSAGSNPLTTVDDVLITTELANRPRRTPDHEIESQALGLLAQEMAGNPRNVLQKCAELVMDLCHADSAGISVLEPGGTDDMLRWQAAAGAFAPNLNGTMPREASPCGTVMERNRVLLFNEAERFFPALQGVEPRIYENLLAPWHVEGKAVGTLWAIKHTAEGRFDAEDARILQSLARFAAAAFQMVSALNEAIAERSAVRELEKRKSFLLELSDALRPVSEAREVQAITTRLVGTHLEADRAMYAEVDGKPGFEAGTIHAQFVRQAADGDTPVARFPDHFTFDPFGAHMMAARYRGDPLVVTDVANDPAFGASERVAWQKAGVCAAIVAPLSKGGRLVAEFGVHSVGPRDWTTDDVALVQEVAERTWAAAERARAEEALRWSEEKYRTVFESMDEGFLVHQMIRNEAGKVVDYRLLEANPAHQRSTGLPPETIGKLGSEFMPDVESHWLDLFHRVSTSGVAERSEMYNAPTSRWYNVQVSPVRGQDRIAIVFDDVTTRKQAETQLRESEERQTFLLKLSDAIRPYSSPTDIQGETTRLLRKQLNAAWCYYVDWDLSGKIGLVLRDRVGEGLPSLAGAHDVSDAPEFLELLASGAVLTVRDYAGYERLPPRIRQQFVALGFRSMMAAPFVREGRLIATLLVGDTEVRDWSASERSLLAEVAERTWAAIERARAESALRESEARLAHDLEATQVLQNISNKLISKPGVNGHFDELCEAARALMRSDCASIQAYDESSSRLKLVGHVGFHSDSADFWEWVGAGVGSACGRAISKGERVVVPDIDLFEAGPLDVEAFRRSAILSVQSTPLPWWHATARSSG